MQVTTIFYLPDTVRIAGIDFRSKRHILWLRPSVERVPEFWTLAAALSLPAFDLIAAGANIPLLIKVILVATLLFLLIFPSLIGLYIRDGVRGKCRVHTETDSRHPTNGNDISFEGEPIELFQVARANPSFRPYLTRLVWAPLWGAVVIGLIVFISCRAFATLEWSVIGSAVLLVCTLSPFWLSLFIRRELTIDKDTIEKVTRIRGLALLVGSSRLSRVDIRTVKASMAGSDGWLVHLQGTNQVDLMTIRLAEFEEPLVLLRTLLSYGPGTMEITRLGCIP